MVINVEVKLREGESQDKLLKRFLKKCKKAEIVREYCEKTMFFETKSQKKREKRRRSKFLLTKEQKERID